MSRKFRSGIYEFGQFNRVSEAGYIETGRAPDGFFRVRLLNHEWDFERIDDAEDLIRGLRDVFEVACGKRVADVTWSIPGSEPTAVAGVRRRRARQGETEIFIGSRGYLCWDSEDEVQRTLCALSSFVRDATLS